MLNVQIISLHFPWNIALSIKHWVHNLHRHIFLLPSQQTDIQERKGVEIGEKGWSERAKTQVGGGECQNERQAELLGEECILIHVLLRNK